MGLFDRKPDNDFDPQYALQARLLKRDVDAAYEFMRLFRDRHDLSPIMEDLLRAVALVMADQLESE
jgi:hypothetical protein